MAQDDELRLVFVLGSRVYGYSDAPLRREVIIETDSAGKPLEIDSRVSRLSRSTCPPSCQTPYLSPTRN